MNDDSDTGVVSVLISNEFRLKLTKFSSFFQVKFDGK
jgi:hypothetical protein